MVEVTDIAPNAMTKEESDQLDHTWRILIYGNPGVGKTHFAMTMPEPVCVLDTEGKAHDLTDKFDKEIVLWQPKNYDELTQALAEALDLLNAVQDGNVDGFEAGRRGTIVVDSMALVWDWAQQKHLEKAYPGKDPGEVNFESALQGGEDWQVIKRYHNEEFRERMVDSDFHLCWTATSSEDYGAVLSGEAENPPMKPNGEKNNVYKATEMLHFFEGRDGRPRANLKKSGLTRLKFGRLLWPTFPKVRDRILSMEEAEKSDEEVSLDNLEEDLEVDIFTGDPDVIYREGGD